MENKEFDVIVLGAGITGVTTAYFNCLKGRSVCVIDRQEDAALETTFANGGQISVSHAEPWANPSAPTKVLKWLFHKNSPLLFRPKLDVWQWMWIAGFWYNCLPHLTNRNIKKIVETATQSRHLYQQIRVQEHIAYNQRSLGILHFYRDRKEFDGAAKAAILMQQYGCDRQVIDTNKIVELEPALAENKDQIVGGTYTQQDESGDAKIFTQELADVCKRKGVKFLYNTEITNLLVDESKVEIFNKNGYDRLWANNIVVCLGSFSAPFLRPHGIYLNIYPAKGYSATLPIVNKQKAPKVSLTDDEYKIVYSNLGETLRVAGTAELSGYSRKLIQVRCLEILIQAAKMFPEACDYKNPKFWSGLRPTTPSNVPYVGKTKYNNLWLNTGHGTLGWTMGAGTGWQVAEMIGK